MNIYLYQRIVGIGALVLHILILFLIFYCIYRKKTQKKISFVEKIFIQRGQLVVALAVFFAFMGSLIFSDIYHLEACKLCWLQRVALYPQLIIMIIAMKTKDTKAWLYSFWLSLIGFFIASYQTLEQFRIKALPQAKCVIGPDAACSKIHILEFGYITLPVISLSIFIFILMLYFLQKNNK